MSQYIRMVCTNETFCPVDHEGVKWLDKEADYDLVRTFWPIDVPLTREDWEGAYAEGYRYCAIIGHDEILSIGAVWEYSPERWEVAAIRTAQDLRSRGFATQIVSFLTEHILATERIATCTTEASNVAMIHVAEKVGFRQAPMRRSSGKNLRAESAISYIMIEHEPVLCINQRY